MLFRSTLICHVCHARPYGSTVKCERVNKFNRKALYKSASVSTQPQHTCDKMINKVGQPGSDERKAALIEQYAKMVDNEESPFA